MLKQLITLGTLCYIGFSQILKIQGPSNALNHPYFKETHQANFTVANFGIIPWGKRILSHVVLADEIEACQNIKPVADFIEASESDDIQFNSFNRPIVLVERGKCKFTQKARNVQQAGGGVALIFDDIVERSDYITMGDDGSGDSVTIPSVFISYETGKNLVEIIKSIENNGQKLLISIEFDIEKRNLVEVGLYINLPDEKPLFFIDEFREAYDEFDPKKVKFYPVYQFNEGGYLFEDEVSDDCLGGGKYCCYDPDGPGTATGRQIAEEQLRQICFYKEFDTTGWFDYMKKFHSYESEPQTYSTYSDKVLTYLESNGYSDCKNRVNDCVKKSAEQGNIQKDKNYLLEEQLKLIEYSGVFSWPAIHVNNITYSGRYAPYPVEEAICAAQQEPSKRCQKILDPFNPDFIPQQENEGLSTVTIIAIILSILLVVFVIILWGYKRYVSREMKSEMKGQVNEMVSNYVKYYEAQKKDTEDV